MEGDLLGGLMRWQALLWVLGVLGGALALLVRALYGRAMRDLDARFSRLDALAGDIRRVDDELARLRTELPMHYIRRDDHIRDITALSVKLDRIYELLIHRARRGEEP